jgi:hypothetical protein
MIPKLRCRRLLQNTSSTSLLDRDLVKTGVIYLATRARRASTQPYDYEIGSFTYVYFAKRDQLKTVLYGMHH